MNDSLRAEAGGSAFTRRLRLVPVGAANADDLWLVHSDDEVLTWYGNDKPTRAHMEHEAMSMGESWRLHGVHKWIAYDRVSGEVVGRGGLSRTPVDDDWGRIYEFLPAEPWVRNGIRSAARSSLPAHRACRLGPLLHTILMIGLVTLCRAGIGDREGS